MLIHALCRIRIATDIEGGDGDVAATFVVNAAETHHAGQGDAAAIRIAGALRVKVEKVLPGEALAFVGNA